MFLRDNRCEKRWFCESLQQFWFTWFIQWEWQAKFHYSKPAVLDRGYKYLKDFIIVNGELYHQGNSEVLTRVLSLTRQKKNCVGFMIFLRGENDISLYRHLYSQGFYWREIVRDVVEMQMACTQCQESPIIEKPLLVQEAGDWRLPIWISFCIKRCHLIALMRWSQPPKDTFPRVFFPSSLKEGKLTCIIPSHVLSLLLEEDT